MITCIDSSTAEYIGAAVGVPGLHLVHNEALERMLFDRGLMGSGFRRTCLDASRRFVAHLGDELAGADEGHVAELIVLSKGLMYQLAEAVLRETGRNLPTNLVATTRVSVSADDTKVEVSYARFDAGGSTLLIGDTVASGATIVTALDAYRRTHEVRRIHVVSFAGALAGAARISDYCARHGIECTMLFGLAAFGLAENGFDLSFLHPETVTRQEYRDRAVRQFRGRPVSAVGWDFGSQAMAPDKYRQLCWLEAERWGLHDAAALSVARRPDDRSAVAAEAAAYSDTFPEGTEFPAEAGANGG